MKQFLIITFLLGLTSCLQKQDESEPVVACVHQYAYAQSEPTPEPLPNLNVNPIYLEMKYNGWVGHTPSTIDLSYHGFKVAYTNAGYKSEISIQKSLSSDPYYKNYKCKTNIANADFNSLVLSINSAKICKSLVYTYENSCGIHAASMALPSSLYIVNEDGPLSINFSSYGTYENYQSFCDYSEVTSLQNQISDLYSNIDLENDCELQNSSYFYDEVIELPTTNK